MNMRLFVIAALIAFVAGCSGGSPTAVAKKFWDAVNDGDLEKAKKYASKETGESLTLNNSGDAEVDVQFGAITVKGDRTIIETRMESRMGDFTQKVEMKTVLVQEDGKWKVDVMNTMMSMFGDQAQEMMQGMTEAMGKTLEDMGTAMLEEMQKGFAQFGSPDAEKSARTEPEVQSSAPNYRVKFGYMRKRQDDRYYVYKQTKKIPMRTGRFRWGYTIEGKDDPFTTYAIDYSPDGPMGGGGSPRTNRQGEVGWESNTTTVTDGFFYRTFYNDPGDSPGKRKIEIFIDDRLTETIEFQLGKP